MEFHLFKLTDANFTPEDAGQPGTPPAVSLLSHGYQYLTEQRSTRSSRRWRSSAATCWRWGSRSRSVELEFGPSQCEFTFAPPWA